MSHLDELISASLTNDMTDAERGQMDAHLARCERCRDTLAAFADERRLISGMRHVPVPRDLAPRVRTGIESGRRPGLPWWRRSSAVLAVAASVTTAAVALALAVFIFKPNGQFAVGSATPTPSASASATEQPSSTGVPSETVVPTPSPSTPPSVQPTPSAASAAEPAGHLFYELKDGTARLSFVRPDGASTPLDVQSAGFPADASLSPDGSILAFRIDGELSGLSQVYVYNLNDGKLMSLGESMTASFAIGQELAWRAGYLAYTLTTLDLKTDVWIYGSQTGEMKQITNTGDAFAGSFMPTDSGKGVQLWVSRAADRPVSYLMSLPAPGAALPDPRDPAQNPVSRADGVFEPLVAPDGKHVIFWRGSMGTPGGHWSFATGGMPWLADVSSSGAVDFSNARQVFSTLAGGRESFSGASITWGPDSDAFVVWNAQWTGVPQGDRFPDSNRVYFGHVSNPELITPAQTLDQADTQGANQVVDVALAADGLHLGLTLQMAPGAEGGAYGPTGMLRLITRGYGTDPDKVETIGQDRTWNGPAVYALVAQP